jgi:DNA-binding Xre family transcriptional regulator
MRNPRKRSLSSSSIGSKSPAIPMTEQRKLEVIALYTDDVLAKLTTAFFEVVSKEKWGKRDLSAISGLNETAIGHILSGRRKNLTIETIALLARSMKKRPELFLHDMRPSGNNVELYNRAAEALVMPRRPSTIPRSSAASALTAEQGQQYPHQSLVLNTVEQTGQGLEQSVSNLK